MAFNTLISWCKHTLNFWWGCVEVSEACRDCYARELDKMRGPLFDHGNTHWGKAAPRWLRVENAVKDAEKMNRQAIKEGGERPRVFINSMSDTFEDHSALPEARRVLFATIERLTACNWLLLTKRPENIRNMVPFTWLTKWPAHVWVGTTVENEKVAYSRVLALIHVPAAVRFLSCEPLLEELDIRWIFDVTGYVSCGGEPECSCKACRDASNWPRDEDGEHEAIHWVICGGESGSKARAFDIAWARSLRDQCKAAGVPFFMKQVGSRPFSFTEDGAQGFTHSFKNQNMDVPPRMEWHLVLKQRHGANWDEWPEDLRIREVPS